ncbi:MAG: hypothetical protein U0941_15575 [Planctomycetaceae bacterium]
MVCTHLKELYVLCEQHDLRLGGSDLIRIVCRQCGNVETCPSVLMDEYDSREPDGPAPSTATAKPETKTS